MKTIHITLLLFSILLTPLFAKLNVVVTYPYIAQLTKQVGGENTNVITLAKGNWDPHFVVPRPSLIRKVSRANLLIMNGAQLEIGWLPPLIRQANSRAIQPGSKGFLDLSQFVTLMNKPIGVSRANGDIHPSGNPHYATDPFLMPQLADAIAARLSLLDPEHAPSYAKHAADFKQTWQGYLTQWQKDMAPLSGTKVIQYHELYNYFLHRFHIISVGNIEPLPGINPSSKHTFELIKLMKHDHVTRILQDVYHNPKTAHFIAEKTGATVITLPHDVHAVHEADTLEHLYETVITRMTQP